MQAKHGKGWANRQEQLPPWIVILVYVVCSSLLALLVPRLEYWYLPEYTLGMSPAAALTICGAIASGMLALMGIVFSLAFVDVEGCTPDEKIRYVCPCSVQVE